MVQKGNFGKPSFTECSREATEVGEGMHIYIVYTTGPIRYVLADWPVLALRALSDGGV